MVSSGRRLGWRRFSSERFEVPQSDLDQRTHCLVEPGFPCNGERFLVRLAHLLDGDALLQPIVARDEQLLDPRPRALAHARRLAGGRCYSRSVLVLALWLQASAVLQVLLSAMLVVLVLMHSGRDAGFGGMGFTPASQGGTHIVERNLTRLTVVVGTVFFVNTLVLFHLL
jgi:preprotein translocase subunit SecG